MLSSDLEVCLINTEMMFEAYLSCSPVTERICQQGGRQCLCEGWSSLLETQELYFLMVTQFQQHFANIQPCQLCSLNSQATRKVHSRLSPTDAPQCPSS